MKIVTPLFFALLLFSCAVDRTVVEHDDMYVWRRLDVPTSAYEWRGYHDRKYSDPEYNYVHSFVRQRWYYDQYWNANPTVIVIPKMNSYIQPGKRPDRGGFQDNRPRKPSRGRD